MSIVAIDLRSRHGNVLSDVLVMESRFRLPVGLCVDGRAIMQLIALSWCC